MRVTAGSPPPTTPRRGASSSPARLWPKRSRIAAGTQLAGGYPVASFERVEIGPITGDQAGMHVWWWLRQARDKRTLFAESAHETDFGLRLVVHVPAGRAVKLAGM